MEEGLVSTSFGLGKWTMCVTEDKTNTQIDINVCVQIYLLMMEYGEMIQDVLV